MAEKETTCVRTCIGCGTKAEKKQLYRIVRCVDKSVRFDPTGHLAGRGAYVCSQKCFKAIQKTNKLQRALRVSVKHEDAERVAADINVITSTLQVRYR